MQAQLNYIEKNANSLSQEEKEYLGSTSHIQINWSAKWKVILEQLCQLNVNSLQTHTTNDYPPQQLLKEIVAVPFPNLTILNLNNSNIISIEPIRHLKAQSLVHLTLGQNKICNIKSLRKIYCPRLQKLKLNHNPIIDSSPLQEIFSTSKQLHLSLQKVEKSIFIGTRIIKNPNFSRSLKFHKINQSHSLFKFPFNFMLIILKKQSLMKNILDKLPEKQKCLPIQPIQN